MYRPEPKYPVGTRVRVINETHRNGEIGYVDKVGARRVLDDFVGYTYYVQFKGGVLSSFFEANIEEEAYTAHLKKTILKHHHAEMTTTEPIQSSPRTLKHFENIGAISTAFAEADIHIEESFLESFDPSAIRTVTRKDATSKHSADWFFEIMKTDYFADIDPKEYRYSMIIHSDDIFVYGYFSGDKLDGIIRVDEYVNSYYLSFFFVNKACQQRGIGQYLFQFVTNRFSDKKLILNVYADNAPAIHIYKKYGFKITGTALGLGYRPKAPSRLMERDVVDSRVTLSK